MTFLAPLVFLALAGLAIPVLLHLTQREKKQVMRFPSLMFVRRIPYQSVRRRKIHNWLLLAVRLAALALVVLAFARPFIDREGLTIAGTADREVVVLLDTSYSMGLGNRWAQAQAAAHEAVAGLTASDRGSIVLFSSDAEIQIRSTAERSRLDAAIDAAAPGAAATRFSPALKVAGSILAESMLPRREVVLVSDFQRSGWLGAEGAELPEGAVLMPVPIQDEPSRANLSVTGVTLSRSTFSNQQRVVVTAGIANRTERPVSDGTIALEVAGLPVASKPVDVEPGGSAAVAFEPFTLSTGNTQGTVRLGEDALAADNTFNFVLSPSRPVRVTVVDRGSAAAGLYLSNVLAIGESPGFEAVSRRPDGVSDEDLRTSAVLVLNDVEVPVALARRMARFVAGGGGVFVATGSRARWPQEVDLLPAAIGPPVDRTRGEPARVGGIEYGHPVFSAFRTSRSGDFSSIPVYGFRDLTAAPDASVLARFDAGTPAVLERRVGEGRVLLWASTLDATWSDLPTKPVFPILVHQSVLYLAGYAEPQPWLTVGQVLDTGIVARRGQPAPRVAVTPSGERLAIGDEGTDVLGLAEQGFYDLRDADNASQAVVAVNVDPAEADVTPMDPGDIAVATGPAAGGEGAGILPLTPEARERSQRIWWYLLCVGLVLLGADTILSNRMAKA